MWNARFGSKRVAGLALVFLLAALVSATALIAEEKAVMDKAKAEAEVAEDTYPLDTCVVSGGKLGSMGDAVVYDYEGREIRFCCAGCVKQFEGDPEMYIKKLDEAIIARDLPDYPLEVGLVTGKSLADEKVTPVNLVYEDQLVRLYSLSAVKTFEKDPDKYLKKLDRAKKIQAAQVVEMKATKEAATEHKGHSCGGH